MKNTVVRPVYQLAAVVGPTASGKTALAVELAKQFDGEIVSCDSMQIYKGMNIGTAKADDAEKRGIPHHMIDIADPHTDKNYSCADYAVRARETINDIISRGKFPIICGGTGLYLDAVIKNTVLSEGTGVNDGDTDIRAELEKYSAEELYSELRMIDPNAAEKIHPNNVKRVIRALEIYKKTGITKTEWDERSHLTDGETSGYRYDTIIIGLDFREREKLYDRINLRVDLMLEAGLTDEVKKLELDAESTAGQAIGYKEIMWFLEGKMELAEAVEKVKQGSRNYAKRQLTWFKRNPDIKWIYVDEEKTFKNIVNNAAYLLTNR